MNITTMSKHESTEVTFGTSHRGRLSGYLMLVFLAVFAISACGGGARTGGPAAPIGEDTGGTTNPDTGTPDGGTGVGSPNDPLPPPPPGAAIANQASIDFYANNVLLPTGGTSPISVPSNQAFQGLRTYCGPACHEPLGVGPPKFASTDAAGSHSSAVGFVDFVTPAASQMVAKLGTGLHNCWVPGSNPLQRSTNAADCASNAADLAALIQAWADARAAAGLQLQVLASQPARLGGSARYEQNIIAKYQFTEGAGDTVFDTSGVAPAADLTVTNMDWSNGGLTNVNNDGKAEAPANTSAKLYDMIAGNAGSGEYTIEAWVVPTPGNQTGPARTVNYSIDTGNRNFTMGQDQTDWIFRSRQNNTDNNGNAFARAAQGSVDQNNTLQHVVMTFNAADGRKIFINGVETQYENNPDNGGNSLRNWNRNYRIVVGNEVTQNRVWRGTYRFVAVFNQALTPAQVQTNYSAGPNGGSTVQFDVSALTNIPNSFVQFSVGEFDSNAYLFTNPEFIVGQAGGGATMTGSQLYTANCATCHNARSLTTVDNPSLASIQNAMTTIPNMVNSASLQQLGTAQLQLISDYLLDGQALYQVSCATAGCHATRAVQDTSLNGIQTAIAQNRGGMGAITLLDVKLQVISDFLVTGNGGNGGNPVAAPAAGQPLASPFDIGFMRVAVNGQVPAVGQSFGNMYTMVNSTRQNLSGLGAVIKQGLGSDMDEFHLEFGRVANVDVRVAELPINPPPLDTVTVHPYSDLGMRNFKQINDTMAAVTGVNPQDNAVRNMYDELTQQLPEGSDINAFVPSQQVGVTKLAIEYCDRMFDDGGYRNAFFPQDPFNQNNRDATFGTMIDKMIGVNVATQPVRAELISDLVDLFEGDPNHLNSANQLQPITGICRPGNCNDNQFRNAVRVACMATLSNAAMLIH